MTARLATEIRLDVSEVLKSTADVPFEAHGFKRTPKGFFYSRKANLAEHKILIHVVRHPKMARDKEVQFKPYMCLQMDVVSRMALDLAKGDKFLLAGCPEIIINQPVDFVAPKDSFTRWFATGKTQMAECVQQICDFAKCWVIPFFDRLKSPEDLIKIYAENDTRVIRPHHWYVYIAAAYLVKGKPQNAMEVLEAKLGSTGLKKDFAVIFNSVREKMKK